MSAPTTQTTGLPTNSSTNEDTTTLACNNITTTTNGSSAGSTTSNGSYSSRPKTEVELAAEKLYEERMEDEYAKREGGA